MVSLSVTYNLLSHPLNITTSKSVGNFEYLRLIYFLHLFLRFSLTIRSLFEQKVLRAYDVV